MGEPWKLSIVNAAERIRRRELSSEELVDSVLRRLRETEEYARSWAYVDERGARAAAAAADRDLQAGVDQGPLVGIPIGVKDVIDVKGLPTEAGSNSLRGNIASADADSIRQLRNSGAIILGKTETYEFAFGQGTPPSRNPWDPTRYAGGSSIGSGVAVAVGSAPGALGTDTGGSVRNPASINGLVGLKPTTGMVSSQGMYNVSHTLDHIGPITRTAADCAALFDGMVRPEAAFRLVRRAGGVIPAQTRLAIDRAQWEDAGMSDGVGAVLDQAVADLEQVGFQIVELRLPQLAMALPTGLAICLSESVQHHRERLQESPQDYLPETRVMIGTGALIPEEDVFLARQVQKYLRSTITATLDSVGATAIISPTLPAVAPIAAEMTNELTGEVHNNSLSSALKLLSAASVSGLPGVSIACGFSDGQPVGMHLMGRMYADHDLLSIGNAYEEATMWHTSVPVVDLPALASLEHSTAEALR